MEQGRGGGLYENTGRLLAARWEPGGSFWAGWLSYEADTCNGARQGVRKARVVCGRKRGIRRKVGKRGRVGHAN